MSRIGREPITVPAGVTVTVAAGNVVTVKGLSQSEPHRLQDLLESDLRYKEFHSLQ